jgi:hypothetical protein
MCSRIRKHLLGKNPSIEKQNLQRSSEKAKKQYFENWLNLKEKTKLKQENCQLKEENRIQKERLQQLYEEKSSENQPNFATKQQPSISELSVHESFFQRDISKPSQLQKLIKLKIYQFEELLKKFQICLRNELQLVNFVEEQL